MAPLQVHYSAQAIGFTTTINWTPDPNIDFTYAILAHPELGHQRSERERQDPGLGFTVKKGPTDNPTHLCLTLPANVDRSDQTIDLDSVRIVGGSAVGIKNLAHLAPHARVIVLHAEVNGEEVSRIPRDKVEDLCNKVITALRSLRWSRRVSLYMVLTDLRNTFPTPLPTLPAQNGRQNPAELIASSPGLIVPIGFS